MFTRFIDTVSAPTCTHGWFITAPYRPGVCTTMLVWEGRSFGRRYRPLCCTVLLLNLKMWCKRALRKVQYCTSCSAVSKDTKVQSTSAQATSVGTKLPVERLDPWARLKIRYRLLGKCMAAFLFTLNDLRLLASFVNTVNTSKRSNTYKYL